MDTETKKNDGLAIELTTTIENYDDIIAMLDGLALKAKEVDKALKNIGRNIPRRYRKQIIKEIIVSLGYK
jgi:hypothetical protein